MREQRLQSIAQLIGCRFDWPNAMGELSRVLPSDVSLTTLQGTVGADDRDRQQRGAAPRASSGAVSSATPPGAYPTFTLAGCATSQAVVAQTLVRLRLISGVSGVALQSSTKAGGGGGSGASLRRLPGATRVFSVSRQLRTAARPRRRSKRSRRTASGSAAAAATDAGRPPHHGRRRDDRPRPPRDRSASPCSPCSPPAGCCSSRPSASRPRRRRPRSKAPASSSQTAQARPRARAAAQARYAAAYDSVVSLGKAVPPQRGSPLADLRTRTGIQPAQHRLQLDRHRRAGSRLAAAPSARPRRPRPQRRFTQMPFTFIFKGSFFGLAHLLGQIDGFANHAASHRRAGGHRRGRGQRPTADDPGRQPRPSKARQRGHRSSARARQPDSPRRSPPPPTCCRPARV